MTQYLKPVPLPCFSYQYRFLLRWSCRVEGVSDTHRLEPGTWAFSGALTSSAASSRQGPGARVRLEGSEGMWRGKSDLWQAGKPQQAGVEAGGPS